MAETIADVGDDLECPSAQSREAAGGIWWQWFPKQAALVVAHADGRGSVLYGPSVAALVDYDAAFSDTRDFTLLRGVPITRMDCFNGDVVIFLNERFHVVALLARSSKRIGEEAVQPTLILPAMVDDWVDASRSLDSFVFPTSAGEVVDGVLSQQFGSFGERSAPESAQPTKTMLVDEVAHLCGRGDAPLLPSQIFPRVGPR